MKYFLVILSAALAAAGSLAHADSATGSWSTCGSAGAGLWLQTIQTGSMVRFQLAISRGAPAHHSGFIEGKFELHGGKGVFFSAEDGHACEITFTFSPQEVVVSESPDKHDCGFGHGVTAFGRLALDSKEQPSMSDRDERENDFPSCPEEQEVP